MVYVRDVRTTTLNKGAYMTSRNVKKDCWQLRGVMGYVRDVRTANLNKGEHMTSINATDPFLGIWEMTGHTLRRELGDGYIALMTREFGPGSTDAPDWTYGPEAIIVGVYDKDFRQVGCFFTGSFDKKLTAFLWADMLAEASVELHAELRGADEECLDDIDRRHEG
jgi:hypothetical protein